jgi:hypothetical protein
MATPVEKKEDKKEGEVGGLSLDDVTGTLKLISKVRHTSIDSLFCNGNN